MNTVNTVFEGGSMSKWIAAIVVMYLVDRGELSLDTSISHYLPEYRNDSGTRLTLRNLLSHGSGLPNEIIPAVEAAVSAKQTQVADPDITVLQAAIRYASGDLKFKPGTQFDYSHSNWLVVQAIVEKVTTQSYQSLAHDILWSPLRLLRSGIFSGLAPNIRGMAVSYKTPEGAPEPELSLPSFMEMIAGYFTDATDLLRLMNSVCEDGGVLSQKARAEMFKVQFPEKHYALGCRVQEEVIDGTSRTFLAASGSTFGFRAVASRLFHTGENVIVLNNTGMDEDILSDFALSQLRSSRVW